jgi:hypothetical protein
MDASTSSDVPPSLRGSWMAPHVAPQGKTKPLELTSSATAFPSSYFCRLLWEFSVQRFSAPRCTRHQTPWQLKQPVLMFWQPQARTAASTAGAAVDKPPTRGQTPQFFWPVSFFIIVLWTAREAAIALPAPAMKSRRKWGHGWSAEVVGYCTS